MREHYDEIQGLGAEIVAVGTANRRYAADFVEQDRIPFSVLVDDDAQAATAAGLPRVNPFRLLFDPRSLGGARRAHRAGYRIGKPGKRTNQLGATFVVGPGDRVRYEHVDEHTADHAPLDDVFAALRA
ncbi:MAG: redoxin domain-containing protein [Acidimicrobiia bacterium]|nr:redoxin domain-containing protein [Acidimicrobiia bacterium]